MCSSMKEPMTFSWISTGREKPSVLRASRSMRLRRVRLLRSNSLREDFSGQVFLLRHFSGVAPPVTGGQHSSVKGRE